LRDARKLKGAEPTAWVFAPAWGPSSPVLAPFFTESGELRKGAISPDDNSTD
jgi:hypothetical protein